MDESGAGLISGKVRCLDLDTEEIFHPIVLADALMNHLLMNGPPASFRFPGHFDITEHRPGCEDFQPLGCVSIGKKRVAIHVSVSAHR